MSQKRIKENKRAHTRDSLTRRHVSRGGILLLAHTPQAPMSRSRHTSPTACHDTVPHATHSYAASSSSYLACVISCTGSTTSSSSPRLASTPPRRAALTGTASIKSFSGAATMVPQGVAVVSAVYVTCPTGSMVCGICCRSLAVPPATTCHQRRVLRLCVCVCVCVCVCPPQPYMHSPCVLTHALTCPRVSYNFIHVSARLK